MSGLIALPNGVRIFTDPMAGLESVALGVWFKAGAIDEETAEHGVAHLLEHMAFKGTARRTARQIAEEIETVGGHLNASTGYSRTGYYARILKNDLDAAFDILADILINPTFDAGELEKEQEVVVQEIGEAADVPDDAVMDLLQSVTYPNHPLGRPILGTVESVRSHSSDRLRAFMRRCYGPGDTVIATSGAIDADAVAHLAERYFGGAKAIDRKGKTGPPKFSGGSAHDDRDIEQTHIALSFPGCSVRDPKFFATRIFVEALGGGMSSRIFQSIREELGLAYSVYSFTDAYDEVGSVGVYVGTDRSNAVKAVGLVAQEIASMAECVSPAEIDRARAMLKSTLLMGLESPSTRAETAASQLFAYGRLIAPAELCALLDAVTLDEVRDCAAYALTDSRPSLAVVGPADYAAIERVLLG